MFTATPVKQHRILDFDIENRPLSYWYGDVTTAEITAIAWSFIGSGVVEYRTLAPPPDHELSTYNMLAAFGKAYDEADMVTGHYIRRHDLPIINSAMMEWDVNPLTPKLTSDTKLDLVKHGGLPVSQQALGAMLEIQKPKVPMPTHRWRDANRLTPEGIQAAVARVVGDVEQHMEMRAELIERGLLLPPRMWTP